ncbi:MAG: flagellar hook-associated protein FlgL [Candidatus Marinimicrobia bacterium]|nr:flagellar hook-associated protein FlgL [Candidatus Neomarinimicrobiota bacterium]MCF7880540.1 flagellar hook-associated protein FlgL [Candidatus Neomarinimicrobiota bacterium]
MRITNSILYRAIKRNVQKSSENVYKYQEQIASGKRINRPSDDPLGAMKAQQLHTSLNKIDQFSRNHTYAKTWLNASEAALSQSSDLLVRLKEITLAQGSSNSNENTREIAAEEVRTLKDQLLSLANTKVSNRSIFAGHQTGSTTFAGDGTYGGDDGNIYLNIKEGIALKVNHTGEEIFKSDTYKNIFETVNELVTALENNDGETIREKIDEIDTTFQNVNRNISFIGSLHNQVENVREMSEEEKIRHKEHLGEVEEIDLVEAVIGLESARNTYQTALSGAKTISQMNLSQLL